MRGHYKISANHLSICSFFTHDWAAQSSYSGATTRASGVRERKSTSKMEDGIKTQALGDPVVSTPSAGGPPDLLPSKIVRKLKQRLEGVRDWKTSFPATRQSSTEGIEGLKLFRQNIPLGDIVRVRGKWYAWPQNSYRAHFLFLIGDLGLVNTRPLILCCAVDCAETN